MLPRAKANRHRHISLLPHSKFAVNYLSLKGQACPSLIRLRKKRRGRTEQEGG